MSRPGNSDDLLSRWAKRREAVAQEEANTEAAELVEETELAPEPETEEEAMALLSESDPELAEKLSAIDVDKLTYDDDFTVFMSERVPQIIKRRALAKLWLSDPILANVDGLNDYDEDFKATGVLLKAFKSAWEPGRGYARPEENEEAEIAEATEDSEEESVAELAEDDDLEATEIVEAEDDLEDDEDTASS